MRIMKFGGKSLENPQKMQNICKYIKKIYKNDKKMIIIVSAMGNTTNNLIELSKQYYKTKPSLRELDALISIGETQSASLFAMMLNSMNVPAKSFQAWQINISTFGAFQNSKITSIKKNIINECLSDNTVAVIAGFQGINQNNETTTLGRGGSDVTAAAIGAVFDHEVEIYSNFNGICSGDPKLNNFKKIKNLSYSSMETLSENGAKVLEKRAVTIAKNNNIKLICKQSSKPSKKGSTITNLETPFLSISDISNLTRITIVFNGINYNFILKNVLKCLNGNKFYNFNINNNSIQFFIEDKIKSSFINKLSIKLNILSKQKNIL